MLLKRNGGKTMWTDLDKKVPEFVKSLMQPMITIAMMIVFIGYAGQKLFTSDQVWQVVVGVLVFWFGYTAFKFGTGKDEAPKADTPTITPSGGKVAGIGNCAPSTTSSVADDWGYELDDAEIPEAAVAVDEAIDEIYAGLKADGVKTSTAAVASRVVSWLGSNVGRLTKSEEKELLNWGIQSAQYAYLSTTGLDNVPTKYAEVADYNKWWRENQQACKAPKAEAKAILMTLRDLLKRAGK
jgi:hypothetical protein